MLEIQVWHKDEVMKAIELYRCCLIVDVWSVCVAGSSSIKSEYVKSKVLFLQEWKFNPFQVGFFSI